MILPARAAVAALALTLSGCGGGGGFQRPDYAAEARARCDEADSAGDPSRALALYGLALDADPKMARAYYGRALVLEKQGRQDEAQRSFSMAVEHAVDDVRSGYLLGRARHYVRRQRTEAAVRDLDRAVPLLRAFPMVDVEAEVRLLRAECRIRLLDWAGAREDLDAAEKAGLNEAQRAQARPLRIRVDLEKPEERR